MPNKKRFITAEDLYNIHVISDCQISPDGNSVIYAVQRIDRKTEKKYSNLWTSSIDTGIVTQFTHGDHTDTTPRWSPDGKKIAFISNRDNEKQSQIYIIPFSGGEARKLTDFKGDINSYEWSPDGRRLVCSFRKKDTEDIEREEDKQKKELGVVSRHITRVFFKADNAGYLPKERYHLFIIDSSTGVSFQLTDHAIFDEGEPSWSPDSKMIVFTSNRQEDPDLDPDAVDLFVIPAEGGDFWKIETPPGLKDTPIFSPDGKWIAYLGSEGKGETWKNTSLWVIPVDGSGEAQNLTERYDFDISTRAINDVPGSLPLMPPTWAHDSRKIYVQVTTKGNTVLKSVSLKGEIEPVIDDKGVTGSFTLDRNQKKIAYIHAHMKNPGEVVVYNIVDKSTLQVSCVNTVFQELDLGDVEEVWFKGPHNNDVQGWIIRPPDFDKSRKYPSILEIHGGPRMMYGNYFMHEFFFLAASGYVVYFCNPRGSKGYGEEHSKAILNKWGTCDYEDLMAWADFMEKKEYIDAERMGVTGGSYGGYMTNWIIGHTTRFKAAVTQRSVSNWVSMYGSSDFNWVFQYEFGDQPPWDNVENWWQQSPMKYIGSAKTPTLIIHSEQDLRASREQGEQIFVALKRLGVDTELILFPEEPHGLSRTGRTDRRVVRLNHIKRWFERYLT
ncbi:MAG: S9 family peptidase [Theionarchaea archaeon]|nr:S9 family peptidase [Theionarchaea archaeon]